MDIADFDGNGFPDLLIATDEITILKYNGGLEERYSTGSTNTYDVENQEVAIGALAVGDVNGNGRNDVVASLEAEEGNGQLVWYKNQIGTPEESNALFERDELLRRSELNNVIALRGPSVTSPRLASSGDDGIRINSGRLGGSSFRIIDPDVDAPSNVTASNGTRESQVRIRWDDVSNVDGYRIYRDGSDIGTVGASDTNFDDNDARPGLVSEYCVEAFTSEAVSARTCDYGYRPPDGALTGRIATLQSSGVQDVDVCVLPSPGRSLQLDGVEGTAVTRNPVVLNEGDFTISFWVKRTARDASQYVVTQGEASGNQGLQIGFRSADTFTLAFWNNDLNVNTAPSTDWEHWAVTYERASGQRLIYRDGEEVASDLSNGRYEGEGPIYIGSRFAEANYFQGLIDEVRVWDHVRSEDEIRTNRFQGLTGAERGLQAYWPVEQGTGAALADPTDTEGQGYAVFQGGAYRSEVAAPLEVCARTDDQGNYEIAGIRYGNETTFQVTPSRESREFDPARTEITLSTGNPVQNEVGFTDISSYTLEGSVQVAGSQCFVPDLPIALDGEVAGQTDSDGFYSLAAESGSYTLAPNPQGVETPDEESEPRFFRVAGASGDEAYEIDVNDNQAGLDFVETTQRTLRGVAGGGSCGIDIGVVDLLIESEDQCFSRTISIDTGSDPEYVIDDLPPLTYNVSVADVSDVPNGLSKTDILSFFENAFGTQQVDLTAASDTLDVTYRAPLAVSFEGLPERTPQCSSGLTIENRTVANVPVLEQSGDEIPYQILVAEDYGDAGRCPVAEGEVQVFDEWKGTENEPRVLEIEDGVAQDTTVAREPSFTSREVDGVDRTFQQALTASADVDGRTATSTTWALIEGRRTREGTDFVSGQTGPIPLQILRNPPGDGSSSFVEEGARFCRTVGTTTTLTKGLKQEASISGGAEFYKGLGFVTKTELTTELGVSFELTWEAVNKFGSRICAQSKERFSTSTNPVLTGEQGDVFIGTAVNMLFAETDVLEQTDTGSCELERFTEVGYEPEEFDTIYAFSRFHIENSLLPRLSDLMDDARRQADAGNTEAADRLAELQADSSAWMGHLLYNDSLKTEASLVENRSFDAGANYTFSSTSESNFDWSFETSIKAKLDAFVGFEVKESGVGIKGKFTASSALRQAINAGVSTQDTRTVGYTLSDGDVGDYFTVDIKDDPVYNTPVFDLRGGQSSCPVEGPITRLDGTEVDGTVPRYKAVLQANGSPIREGVPPDEPAVFELTLTNDSPSGEAAAYEIRQIHSSNPNGARLSLNGNGLGGALEYYLEPGEDGSQRVTLEVARGATGYRYEDLQIMMYPPCERSLWQNGADLQMADTLSVSVQFEAPCTDVDLFRPRENWTVNAADDDLETILSNFSLTDPRELQEVGLQYRRAGQEGWTDAFRVEADEVRASGNRMTGPSERYELVSAWQEVTNLPDGEYELRAYSFCDGADRRVYSPPALGQIDTKRPEVLATPEPSNQVLSFGGTVSVQFDEQIDCGSVVTEGESPTLVLLDEAGERIAIDAQCTGDQIVIEPREAGGYNAYEAQILTAEVRGTVNIEGEMVPGVTDPAGNPLDTADPLSDTETWSFDVRRQQFAWQRSATTAEVEFQSTGLFEEVLTNGSPEPVVYALESDTYGTDWMNHSWLTLDEPTGTLPAGQQRAITFNVSDALEKGTYQDRIRANSAVGGQELDVTAEVTCTAPFGTPPIGAAYTMNATARLVIPETLGGDGVSTTAGDKVAAFVGSQLRGVASLEPVDDGSGQTTYRAFLNIASDRQAGETVTFQIWDSEQCTVFQAAETYPFQANNVLGDAIAPITFTATDASMQSVPLAEGWTWISVNTETEDGNSVNQVLSTLIPEEDDLVKSQTAFSQFEGSQNTWVGSLNTIEPGAGYLIQLAEASTLFLLGEPVAADQPIDLTAGWNWIGFLPQQAMPINHALKDLEPAPEPGDIIKSQTAFAQYVNENVGWLGSLETLHPGRGYFVRLTEEATLTYPTEPPTQTTVRVRAVGESAPDTAPSSEGPRLMAEVPVLFSADAAMASASEDEAARMQRTVSDAMPEWTVVPADYETSMAVVATLQSDGATLSDPRTRLGAFVDGNLRGVARPQRVQQGQGDAYRAFLTVHGDLGSDEEVTFRLFNPHTGQVHERVRLLGGIEGVDDTVPAERLPSSIAFQGNQPLGTVGQPVRFNVGDLPDDWGPGEFVLEQNFPNPVRSTTTLRFAIPEEDHVTVELYDLLGRRVQTIADESMRGGWHELPFDASRLASGVYFYRLSVGDYRASEKMTIVR
ncbi:MAG: T9SS type A sorting domain-containing protein [Longimonas sp.]|uniref:LamG-like jellyroll fold domain-containing protein n=1 Tax=Longimonas sp. TaxID=2039626 RepID=UPI0033529CE2